LVKNIKSNNYENVIVFPKAVSNRTERINLFLCEEHTGDHRIFDSRDGRNSIEIETVALDDFFSEKERIDFIKMDIQGSEYLALIGMEKLLHRNEKLILISEFSPSLLKKCGVTAEQFLNKIMEFGFKLQFINEKNERIEPISCENLIKICHGEKYVSLYLEK
jgi:FkbM family methyltransferase